MTQTADPENRGRDAPVPLHIPLRGWLDILARVVPQIGSLRIALLAAGIAFYALLAIFPGITAGVALIGLLYDPAVLVDQAQWLFAILPEAASEIIGGQLSQIAGSSSDSLSIAALIALAFALWSASNAIGSFMQGLNVIYQEREDRSFVKVKLLTIGLTIGMIAVLALTIVVVAAIPAALTLMGSGPVATSLALLLRWPLMFVIGVGGIAVLYRLGPDRRSARWRWITPGAAISCVLWVAGSYGFSIYVQSFASYNETFGTLAGVIILLTWLWLSAFVVLLGALLDAETEAQTARDSTVGPDRPMGQRGAVKADTLGRARGQQDKETEEPTAFGSR